MKRIASTARNLLMSYDASNGDELLDKAGSVKGDASFEPVAELCVTAHEPDYQLAVRPPVIEGGQPTAGLRKTLKFETFRVHFGLEELESFMGFLGTVRKELIAMGANAHPEAVPAKAASSIIATP